MIDYTLQARQVLCGLQSNSRSPSCFVCKERKAYRSSHLNTASPAFLITRDSSEHCFWAHAALQISRVTCSIAVQHFLAEILKPQRWHVQYQTESFSLNVFFPRTACFSERHCLKCNWKSAALSPRLPLSSFALLSPSHFLLIDKLELLLFTCRWS